MTQRFISPEEIINGTTLEDAASGGIANGANELPPLINLSTSTTSILPTSGDSSTDSVVEKLVNGFSGSSAGFSGSRGESDRFAWFKKTNHHNHNRRSNAHPF